MKKSTADNSAVFFCIFGMRSVLKKLSFSNQYCCPLIAHRNSNGCSSGYFTKKGLFEILTVVSALICLNLSKISRVSVK